MVKDEFINAGDFDRITALSREAVSAMLGFHVVHLGVNAGDAEAAGKAARFFSGIFGFASKDGGSSVFAGDAIEIMKIEDARGKHGHIGIGTNSVVKAAAFLERQGIALDWDNAKKDAKGKITLLYLREEIAGFAIHIVASPQAR
jgi:2-dehydro-3-deoxyphosphogluconate aldolase/(4S)-4-hydroxy-2-oxoglutarate aldolase